MRVQGCDEIGLALAMPTAAVAIRTSLEEAAKGDVVCSNCHRHRTFVRRHSTRE